MSDPDGVSDPDGLSDPDGVDPDDTIELLRVLRRIEGHHDADGWRPAGAGGGLTVYVVYENGDVVTDAQYRHTMGSVGPALKCGRYTAHTMLPYRIFRPGLLAGQQEYQLLRNFAVNTVWANPARMSGEQVAGGLDLGEAMSLFRQVLAMPGVIGFAACYEAHQRNPCGEADFRQALTGQRPLREHPDAVEVRLTVLVDSHDRVHTVTRRRDQPAPEFSIDAPMRGDVSTSLRMLMDGARGRAPMDQTGFDERYPSLAQTFDRRRRR